MKTDVSLIRSDGRLRQLVLAVSILQTRLLGGWTAFAKVTAILLQPTGIQVTNQGGLIFIAKAAIALELGIFALGYGISIFDQDRILCRSGLGFGIPLLIIYVDEGGISRRPKLSCYRGAVMSFPPAAALVIL
jgi:hypothetical protein